MRGSIADIASGETRIIGQGNLYAYSLVVAITRNTSATYTGGEIVALGQLVALAELKQLLEQADELHVNSSIFPTSSSVAATFY